MEQSLLFLDSPRFNPGFKRKILALLFPAIFIFCPGKAEAQQFCATVNAVRSSSGVVQDNNGNYIVSGSGKTTLIKIDNNATLDWIKEYTFSPAPLYEYNEDLIITQDGDFVGVNTVGITSTISELQIYKTDSFGNMRWVKRFSQVKRGSKVLELPDKSLIVTGDLGNNVAVIKLDGNGNIIWAKSYGTSNNIEYIYSALLANNSLQFSIIGSGNNESWISTFDSSGKLLNENYIGPGGFSHKIINTSDGGKAFCYYGQDTIFFGKLAANNTKEWVKTLKLNPMSYWVGITNALIENNSGELVFVFYEDQTSYSPCVLSMSLSGNFIRANIIDNFIEKLMKTQDGGIIGVGSNYTTLSTQISKFDNQNSACCYYPPVTLTFNNYNLRNKNVTNSVNPATVLSQSVSASSVNISGYTLNCFVPKVNGLQELNTTNITIYPNPAQDVLKVISNKKIADLKIYDVLGKLVKEVNNSNTEEINVKDLKAGLYFIQMGNRRIRFVKE